MERSVHFQSNESFVCLFNLGFNPKGLSCIPSIHKSTAKKSLSSQFLKDRIFNSNGFFSLLVCLWILCCICITLYQEVREYLYVDEPSSIDTNGHVYLVHRVNRVHSSLTTDWRRFTLLLVCSRRNERFLSPLRLIPVNFKSSSTAFHNLV